MATYQLGPEAPKPFCCVTEDWTKWMNIPHIPEYEKYSFGSEYEKMMCHMVHKYLELDTDDRMCYVGDNKGSLVSLLQNRFCLVEPVTAVVPGHIHYEESPRHKMLAIKISHTGAEEFFRVESTKRPAQFDKVLLKDAIHYFDNPKEAFRNIFSTLSQDRGKLLIVHRPAFMNTLPLFSDAKERMLQNDEPYMGIIQDLQSCNLDVRWEIECLPVVMPKTKWLAMVKERFPQQLESVSQYEVGGGIRELTEGVLKYGGDMVEFTDRLLFITAQKHWNPKEGPSVQRVNTNLLKPYPTVDNFSFKMEVTDDLKQHVATTKKLRRLPSTAGMPTSGPKKVIYKFT